MIVYDWVSVTAENRYIGSMYGHYGPAENMLYGKLMTRWCDERGLCVYDPCLIRNATEIVESAVADFREAVAAAFYDVAKSDATLVPVSCIPHIDSIVYFNFALRFNLYDVSINSSPPVWNFIAPALSAEWKRAVIYRRELGLFTKRMLVGNMFPEEVIGADVSGKPFYTDFKTKDRSL